MKPSLFDRDTPELTLRAVLTGMALGGLLSICNIYAGLKIGWGMNMSISAALLAFVFWRTAETTIRSRKFSILENNLNQTAASAAASVSSAGLVAPIPALTLLTGYQYSWAVLATWTLSVMLVGIVVGIVLRRQLIVVDRLPFPSGIATAATLEQIYSRGREALARVTALGVGAGLASAVTLAVEYLKIPKWGPPVLFAAPSKLVAKGISKLSLGNLGFLLDPSPILLAVGALIGVRAGVSLFLGSLFGWGLLAPLALAWGWASPGPNDPTKAWFSPLLGWLLWPGVAMMVTASLTSLALSWRAMLRSLAGGGAAPAPEEADALPPHDRTHDAVPRSWLLLAVVVVTVFATATQIAFFGITWWTAILGVLVTFLLAVVAGRVTGETNVTPVGAMGKVTQLLFGVLQPGSVAANLMAANVTGGAAAQTGDLLQDLKTGKLLGASPRRQAIAQTFGALAGALVGSAAYLMLIPDAKAMLLTEQWPAPAVATWKAVAELFAKGLAAMPPGSAAAMGIGGGAGILLAVLEKKLPPAYARWVPSPASFGLGFVIPAYQSISLLAGALAGSVAERWSKSWAERFVVVIAAGVIAGESLTGVGIALHRMLGR